MDIDSGIETINRIFKRVKSLASDGMQVDGDCSNEERQAVLETVLEEFQAEIQGNSFLCEVIDM